MIARLHGALVSSDTESVVIDVGGVGYLVFCSTRTLSHPSRRWYRSRQRCRS